MTGTTYRVTCDACTDYVEYGGHASPTRACGPLGSPSRRPPSGGRPLSRRMSAGWEMVHSHDGATFSRRWITTPADEFTPEPSPVEEQTSVLREIRDLLSVSTRKASKR